MVAAVGARRGILLCQRIQSGRRGMGAAWCVEAALFASAAATATIAMASSGLLTRHSPNGDWCSTLVVAIFGATVALALRRAMVRGRDLGLRLKEKYPAAALSMSNESAGSLPDGMGGIGVGGGTRRKLLMSGGGSLASQHYRYTLPATAVVPPTRRQRVIVTGKKKGPKGAAALFDLEALEAKEAELYGTTTPGADANQQSSSSSGDASADAGDLENGSGDKNGGKKNNKKKKGPKGPAAAALDALEELEAAESATTPTAVPPAGAASGSGGGKKKGKKGPKGAAAAALAALEEMEAVEATVGADVGDEAIEAGLGVKKDKKSKGGKKKKAAKADPPPEPADPEAAADDESTASSPSTAGGSSNNSAGEGDVSPPATLEEQIRRKRGPPRVQIAESSQPGFVSLALDKIAVSFRNQEVLTDASWIVQTGDRVGLVGANGGGKTTQLRILSGEVEPTAGEIIKSSASLRLSILKQEFVEELDMTRTLRDELMSVFAEESKVLVDLKRCEDALKQAGEDTDAMQAVLDEMNELQERAETLNVFSLDSKVDKVLQQMGFLPQEASTLVSSFSGGWKMRIGLGKLLLQDPNILLLDEPTNHLDLESIQWMENFLVTQNIPMVIVSHDREFLDNVCTKIVDTEAGVTTQYDGNYSTFLKKKKQRMDAWQSAYDAQQKRIKDDRSFINKNKNNTNKSSAVQQRQRNLDKLLKGEGDEELVARPPHQRSFRFRFPEPPRMAAVDNVCAITGLNHGYEGKSLFKDASLEVMPGNRIALLGPNGTGKSTLLRLLLKREEPTNGGHVDLNERASVQYFEQNQAAALDLDQTVLQAVESVSTTQSINEIRALLGQFMFKGDDVEKKIKSLSGGEKARVALCRMMLTPANFLVLDEPTNHLDIAAKQIIEEALQNYEGTFVVISHDRYFVSKVATTIVNVEDGQLERYDGDYRFFLDQNADIEEAVETRFVDGDTREIGNAVVVDFDEGKRKKTYGGGGGPSGKKDKGVKNAKRQKR